MAGAWALVGVLHLLDVDWVSAVAVLGALASLLRYGRTVLDRIVAAIVLLIGAGCAVGLLWSVWPWGLAPVPIAGAALTVLALTAVTSGRRPVLPVLRWSDLLSLSGALLLTWMMATPYIRADDFAARLGLVMAGEDNARHLALFDAIRHVGGYPFVDPSAYRNTLYSRLVYYPSGWHLTAGMLDGFLRSSATDYGTGASALDHYVVFLLATFGFLVLVVLWAALRIPARQLHLGTQIVVAVVVTTACLVSELPRLPISGYAPEMLGLALMVALIVLLARPASSTKEQLLLVPALIIGIGFSYYFLLPVAAVGTLAWVVRDRRRLSRQLGAAALAALAIIVFAPIVGALGTTFANQDLFFGAAVQRDYRLILALGCMVAAGLSSHAGMRSRVWRRYRDLLLAAALLPASILVASWLESHAPAYYYGKGLHLVLVTLLVGIGVSAVLLSPPARAVTTRRGWSGSIATALPTLLVAGALVLVIPRLSHDPRLPRGQSTWAEAWLAGDINRSSAGQAVAALYELGGDGDTTIVVLDPSILAGYQHTLFLSALRRTGGGSTADAVYDLPWRLRDRIRATLERVSGPIRFVLTRPRLERTVRSIVEENSEWPDRVAIVPLAIP